MRAAVLALATSVACALIVADPSIARACGCLSPPAVSEGSYAVNQQAEQIIFEVEPGWVTAHVLIKYAGDPSKFAWIVPVPEVPELGISPVSAFGLIDQATAPSITVETEDICPISEWTCAYHAAPSCGGLFDSIDDQGAPGFGGADAGASGDPGTPPVTVIDQQVVGDYETVTFRANEATAATQWLRDNGFIVNQTTSIYMESYVQQNMVFVAAKLVPGAGIRAIKPLRMRYRAAYPMVPLILTAVAAEPHLTVTTFVYGNQLFRPMGHPVVTVDDTRIARDTKGRTNYPMVLARAIDEAGGDGFAIEYRGGGPWPSVGQTSFCCGDSYDRCGIGNDSQCQCPGDEFDRADCEAEGDLVDGIELVRALSTKHSYMTRITTRVSAEEMTFDPTFEPDFHALPTGQLSLRTRQASLASCSGAVIDKAAYAALDAKQSCAATYCGAGGTCVVTTIGPACACSDGYVAQRFSDLDGESSVTCVPRTPPVDLRANGEDLPDACAAVSCGNGTCIDRNGVAVCDCNANAAAAVGTGSAPICLPVVVQTASPGAEDYSDGLRDLDVCAPPPPTCGEHGWLIKRTSSRPGVDCGNTQPAAHLTRPGPSPTCEGPFGCGGCQETPGAAPLTTLASVLLVGLVLLRKRRSSYAR